MKGKYIRASDEIYSHLLSCFSIRRKFFALHLPVIYIICLGIWYYDINAELYRTCVLGT